MRLLRSLRAGLDWERRYFDNFATVSERVWRDVFSPDAAVSRSRAWDVFKFGVDASSAKDPATRLMHWDMRTYLPCLFAQDDRMSMANSLESRVPIADPRLVRLAFHLPFEWKFRAGTSKWILRQAVSDVIPEFVLNRQKIGFDTPVDMWIRGQHAAWVRDVLTGRAARERGLFQIDNVKALLDRPGGGTWSTVVWKLLAIEIWAQTFMDGTAAAANNHGR
jgi:asparagine synthase (glutamine-hydrolysing)